MTEQTHDDDLPGMLAVAKGVAEQRWPHTMDAKIWAKEFCQRFNIATIKRDASGAISMLVSDPDQEGDMIGWFANAIMAGYDTACQRIAAPAGKTADERDAARWRWIRDWRNRDTELFVCANRPGPDPFGAELDAEVDAEIAAAGSAPPGQQDGDRPE